MLRSLIWSAGGPAVLGGDTNVRGPQVPGYGNCGGHVLDHVFARGITCAGPAVTLTRHDAALDANLSDHRPVLADLAPCCVENEVALAIDTDLVGPLEVDSDLVRVPSWSDHEVKQAKHMQETFAQIIETMGGKVNSRPEADGAKAIAPGGNAKPGTSNGPFSVLAYQPK